MMKNLVKYIAFVGLAILLFSCEEDERVYMLENPNPPQWVTVPDLNLNASDAAKELFFEITPVDPGFVASAKYSLEASPAGDNFQKPINLITATIHDEIVITTQKLNDALLRRFPANQQVDVEFRIKATLVVDSGTGALGSSANPLTYISETKTVKVTLFPKQ
jgi:hypothetical protein